MSNSNRFRIIAFFCGTLIVVFSLLLSGCFVGVINVGQPKEEGSQETAILANHSSEYGVGNRYETGYRLQPGYHENIISADITLTNTVDVDLVYDLSGTEALNWVVAKDSISGVSTAADTQYNPIRFNVKKVVGGTLYANEYGMSLDELKNYFAGRSGQKIAANSNCVITLIISMEWAYNSTRAEQNDYLLNETKAEPKIKVNFIAKAVYAETEPDLSDSVKIIANALNN